MINCPVVSAFQFWYNSLVFVKKQSVISLIRVSTEEQEMEVQRWRKKKIMQHFGLEEVQEFPLTVSGTVVEKTVAYREAMKLLSRRDVVGMVVVAISRWFRYKLISELGRYAEPFEEMVDGRNKRIFCEVSGEFRNLDIRNSADQKVVIDAAMYAKTERESITQRFRDGKEYLRELPDSKVDDLPTWVDFRRYDQDQVDAGLITKKESKNRGNYSYNDFARNNIKPMFYKFLEGASFYELARDFGYNPADGTTLTIQGVRYALKNEWAIGNKHRTKHVSKKEWSTELKRFRAQNIVEHENPLHIPTILAKTPLVPVEIWNQVQEKFKGRGKGSKEYGRRKKRSTLFLGHPLLPCAKCDALMYAKNGHGNRADVYYCSAGYRFRKKTCSEHQFSRKKLDDEIALEAVLYLTDDDFLDHKLKECMNEDHLAEARARVEAKQRIVDHSRPN